MRPRQFNDQEVLRIAFEQFWRKGVRGTSLAEIARDAGVQRGSLYNAFGSKEALFLSAYRHYARDYLGAVEQTLDGVGSLRERLRAFFDFAIGNFCAGSPPRGCPTTRGLMEIASVAGQGLTDETRQAFAELLTRLMALMEKTLEEALQRGEFHGEPKLAAAHLITVARGLVVLERAYGDEAQLRDIARHAVDTVLGQ